MSNAFNFWKFVIDETYGPSVSSLNNVEKISINWFIPPISKHSGGHINLFRFLCGLEAEGFDCRVIIVNDGVMPCSEPVSDLKENINEWYGKFSGGVYYKGPDVPAAHFSIATGWQTAYSVKNFQGSPHKCYFVQDFEPMFNAEGSESTFAEETYRFGFIGFTAGSWLAEKLAREYRMETHALSFSYNHKLYYPRSRREPEKKRLLCYVRPETPRRGWELTLLTLAIVHQAMPEIEIILAGGHIDSKDLPFPALVTGAVSQEELPDLYSQCDGALVISLTNLSLLPIELMACGVPVVSNSGKNTEWLLKDAGATLCHPRAEDLAKGVIQLFSKSKEEKKLLSEQCREFAATTSWSREIGTMAKKLHSIVNLEKAARHVDTNQCEFKVSESGAYRFVQSGSRLEQSKEEAA